MRGHEKTRGTLLETPYRPGSGLIGSDAARLCYSMLIYSKTECSDERDYVYALLGLLKQTPFISPDYSLSTPEVYTALSRHLIEDDFIYAVLEIAGNQKQVQRPKEASRASKTNLATLPSWCPDWSSRQICLSKTLGDYLSVNNHSVTVDAKNHLHCTLRLQTQNRTGQIENVCAWPNVTKALEDETGFDTAILLQKIQNTDMFEVIGSSREPKINDQSGDLYLEQELRDICIA